MPQLDQFTYFTQFVWLCFFFMTFYVLLFNDGLPKISRILKLRAHLLSQQSPRGSQESEARSEDASFGPAPVEKVAEATPAAQANQDVVFRTLSSGLSYLNSSVSGAFSWCTKSVDSLNATQLKPMNKSYLRSIGEISLSQLIKYIALETSAPLAFNSRSSTFSEISPVWALRVQKCLLSSINKKKKKK